MVCCGCWRAVFRIKENRLIVTMLKTTQGSRNGITVETFKEGQDYDLPKHLIDAFLIDGFCQTFNEEENTEVPKVPEKPKEEEPKNKSEEVPSNKKVNVPSNKNNKKGK